MYIEIGTNICDAFLELMGLAELFLILCGCNFDF